MQFRFDCPQEYRAALYIRLSREDETDGLSGSVVNQKALLDEFVQAQNLCAYDTYIDDGWSGTDFERPAFRRMIADIEEGKINLVLTKDLSRLGRDYIMTGYYLERYFPERRVRYLSLLDGIDTGSDCTANEITPFRAIMNDLYAKDISKKITSVKREKQRKGDFIGGKPIYGYRMHPTEKNRIVLDEPAANIVRRIFQMACSGMSCRSIASRLNEENIQPPSVYAGLRISGKWSGERISDLLQNETYLGCMVQGRRRKVSYKSKKCLRVPKEDWVRVADTHDAIIDEETFAAAQRFLQNRRHVRVKKYDHPLKGLLFCKECAHPLGIINRRNAAGEDTLYFICRTYQRGPSTGACTSHTIRENILREAVLKAVGSVCRCAVTKEALCAQTEKLLSGVRLEQNVNRLASELELLDRKLDRIYRDRLEGTLEEEDFSRIYRSCKAERNTKQLQLTAARDISLKELPDAKTLVQEYFDTDFFQSSVLLHQLIERVEFTADRQLIIHFRCKVPEGDLQ